MGLILESLTAELLVILTALLTYAYYKIKDHQKYFEKFDMEYVPGTFPFGSMWTLFIAKETFGVAIDKIYKYFPEKRYSGFFFGTSPAILIRDPSLIGEVLVKNFSSFHDRGITVDTDLNPFDNNVAMLSGKKWKSLRIKLAPTFTSGKLKWMFNIMNETADNLVELLSQVADNSDQSIKDLLARFSTDVIASCAFGIDSGAIKDPNCQFRRVAKLIFHPGKLTQIKAFLSFLIPGILIKLRIKTNPKFVEDFFIDLTKHGLNYRKETGVVRNDFLQLLLQLREKGSVEFDKRDVQDELDEKIMNTKDYGEEDKDTKLEITDELLAAQLFVFFVAGLDNLANVMALTLYCLSKYPAYQERARKEINEVIQKHGGTLNYSALKEMQFVEACINETLRLYPPGEATLRKCNAEFELGDGHKVHKGNLVVIPLWSLQRDPNYFPDPLEFRPDRWLDGFQPVYGTFLPFGDGPRLCIAERFARLEIKIGVVKSIQNFKMQYSKKNNDPLQFRAAQFQEIVGGVWIKLEKI